MSRRVVVTGVGLVSPLGDDAAGLHAAACEGRHAGARHADWALDGMPGPLAAPHAKFDAKAELGRENLRPLDRTGRLAAAAARRALADSGWEAEDLEKREVGLVLGTLFGSLQTISGFDRRSVSAGPSYAKPMDFANSVINAAAGQAGIRFNLRGANATISGDLTSGLQAIGFAADLIRGGRADAVLAGGADELCVESLYGFHKLGLLCPESVERAVPLSARSTGLMPAEGAALLMLEDADSAERRGARVFAEILGHGSAFDAGRAGNGRALATSMTAAVSCALEDSGLASNAMDLVSLGANGTSSDAAELSAAARCVHGAAVLASKAALGESMGAGGALQTILAIESLRQGVLPGVPGLSPPAPGRSAMAARPNSQLLSGATALMTAFGLQGKTAAVVARLPN